MQLQIMTQCVFVLLYIWNSDILMVLKLIWY